MYSDYIETIIYNWGKSVIFITLLLVSWAGLSISEIFTNNSFKKKWCVNWKTATEQQKEHKTMMYKNSNNHSLQARCAEKHLSTHKARADRWTTSDFCFCVLNVLNLYSRCSQVTNVSVNETPPKSTKIPSH